MSTGVGKAAVIIALLFAMGGVLYLKSLRHENVPERVQPEAPAAATAQQPEAVPPPAATAPKPKPATKTVPKPVRQPAKTPVTTAPLLKSPAPPKAAPSRPARPAQLPRLLELGSDSCRPCQMMQPVLAALRAEYAGSLEVEFIDVWKDTSAGEKYHVQAIPTQIFYDAAGNEVFRHVGYYPLEDIVAKFQELGITLAEKP
jgi:thioredoxin 1